MKTLAQNIAVPNINRWQVDSASFDPDGDVPSGLLRLRFLLVGGGVYGPKGLSGHDSVWELPLSDLAGVSGSVVKNVSASGVRDALITQPNPNTGVFTACWNAWRGAPNTKVGRNNALEAILTNAGIGILSADLAGT